MTSVVDVAGTLPRVSARDAAALARAARALAGMPPRAETTLGPLGAFVVTCDGVHALEGALARESGGDVVLGVARAAGAGRLVIEGALARRVLARVLGGDLRPGAPLARLGLGERGVVAGVVASLLHAYGAAFSVSLVAPGAASVAREGGVALALSVTAAGATGWARLEVPTAWLALAAPGVSDLAELEVEASVELARTQLAARELAAVAPGDAIVFDGEPALAPGAARVVRVVVGGHAARARLEGEGLVILEDVLRPSMSSTGSRPRLVTGRRPEEVDMERREQDEHQDGHQDGVDEAEVRTHATAVLAAAPIEVVAELGRLVLRGEEVVGLGPGAVLALGRAGASPVALRVGGEVWAEGELVEVEGELGVRVTASRRAGFPPRRP